MGTRTAKYVRRIKAKNDHRPIQAFYDRTKGTQVRTDASGVGIGCELVQKHGDHFRPVFYASRKLQCAELNYHISDLEALAVMLAITKFENYLIQLEEPFQIVTDAQALVFLTTKKLTSD